MQNLERRLRNLGESLDTFRKRLDQVNQESAQVRSLLDPFTRAYESLPDSKDKVNMKIKIKRLEWQQAMLEKKAMMYNVGALLAKEMQYNQLDSQVHALEDYITAVEQRRLMMAALPLHIVEPRVLLRPPVAGLRFIPPARRLPQIRIDRGDYSDSSLNHFQAGHSSGRISA